MKNFLRLGAVMGLLLACNLTSSAPDAPDQQTVATAAPLEETTEEPTEVVENDAQTTEATEEPAAEAPDEGPCADLSAPLYQGTPVQVIFTNRADFTVENYSMGHDGNQVFWGEMQPGLSYLVDTVTGTEWCLVPEQDAGLGSGYYRINEDEPFYDNFSLPAYSIIELELAADYWQSHFPGGSVLEQAGTSVIEGCTIRSLLPQEDLILDTTFVNDTFYTANVYWVDWEGAKSDEPFTIAPGESINPGTQGNLHAWCVEDADTGSFLYQNFTKQGEDFVISTVDGIITPPAFQVIQDTACYAGPGESYGVVTDLKAGDTGAIQGIPQEPGLPYLIVGNAIVQDPNIGPFGPCWVPLEHVSFSDDLSMMDFIPTP